MDAYDKLNGEELAKSLEDLRTVKIAQSNARLRDQVYLISLLKEGKGLTQPLAGELAG